MRSYSIYCFLLFTLLCGVSAFLRAAWKTSSSIRITKEFADVSLKLGRNDPCSCGSGKKYKKCCIDNTVPKVNKKIVRSLPATDSIHKLSAGTLVKHGTTSDNLEGIYSKGLLPSGTVSAGVLRDLGEIAPQIQGVYIAKSFVAYSSALISFTAKISHYLSINRFPNKNDNVPLPIVINIRLQEDCSLIFDEDYLNIDPNMKRDVSRREKNLSETIWNKYGSGAILRDGGIPAEWIESVECPHILMPNWLRELEYRPGSVPWVLVPTRKCKKLSTGLQYQIKLMMDDVIKLVYAYYLSCTCSNTTLIDFESIEFIDDGEVAMYMTPSFRAGLGDKTDSKLRSRLSSWIQPSFNPPINIRNNLSATLSSVPSEWEVFNTASTNDLPQIWPDMSAYFKNQYAIILFECAQYFIDTFQLQKKTLS